MSGKEGTQSSTFCMLPYAMHIYGSAGGTQPVVKHRRYQTTPELGGDMEQLYLQRIKKSPY